MVDGLLVRTGDAFAVLDHAEWHAAVAGKFFARPLQPASGEDGKQIAPVDRSGAVSPHEPLVDEPLLPLGQGIAHLLAEAGIGA